MYTHAGAVHVCKDESVCIIHSCLCAWVCLFGGIGVLLHDVNMYNIYGVCILFVYFTRAVAFIIQIYMPAYMRAYMQPRTRQPARSAPTEHAPRLHDTLAARGRPQAPRTLGLLS